MNYLKINILVVEDNLQDYIIFKEILGQIRDFFIHIEHAQNISDALCLVKENTFDIIFLDLFLPDSFGQDTFTTIEPSTGATPIVVLSGLSDKNIALDIVKLGAQDYIVKGEFDAALLEKSIIYSIERKKYQDRLEKSEKKYRSTFQSVGVAIGEYDYTKLKEYVDELKAQGVQDYRTHVNLNMDNYMAIRSLLRLTQINPQTLRLYECNSMEEFNEHLGSFYVEGSLDHLDKLISALWDGADSYEGEAHFTTKTGKPISTWKQAKFLGNELGYYRMLMSTSDITSLKQKEEQVRAQSHILKGISDGAAIMLSDAPLDESLPHVLEITGKVLEGEKVAMFRLSNLDTEPTFDLRYQWVSESLLPDQILEFEQTGTLAKFGMIQFLKGLLAGQTLELYRENAEGPFLQFMVDKQLTAVMAAPIFVHNKLYGAILLQHLSEKVSWTPYHLRSLSSVAGNIASSISRHTAEEELVKLNANLEQMVADRTRKMESAIKELESFSYSVSHDLRAPLRAISGFSHVLNSEFGDKLNEEGQKFLSNILKGAKDMSQLIDDLLDFSRVGKRELEFAMLDMESLVHEIVQQLTAQVPDRNLNFKVHPLPKCQGDKAMMKQVLSNFIWNAIKYTQNEEIALIEIGAHEKGSMAEFYIKDNGVGFDMAYADKLFGVFQRLHPEEEFQGTGVGLAIVQRIVRRHSGAVWAVGNVNEGATFYFSLPLMHTLVRRSEESYDLV